MLTEIIISGFGGQGILFAGKCLAYGAMLEGLELSWLPSYGPEMRGGTANCSVCISDEPISSPLVTEPDILIAMNAPSVEKFLPMVKTNGKVFIDSSIAEGEFSRNDVEIFKLNASEIADRNNLGGMGNIVLLGKAIKECGLHFDAVNNAFDKVIPKTKSELIEKNKTALLVGFNS